MSEETTDFNPKFDENGLIAAIAQDAGTKNVLMVAWMNEEALTKTLATRQAHYWSRSRKELWHKGATSGAIQRVQEIRIDCDQDAVLMLVKQEKGGVCHTGRPSCFYRTITQDPQSGQHMLVFEMQKPPLLMQILPKFFDYFRQS